MIIPNKIWNTLNKRRMTMGALALLSINTLTKTPFNLQQYLPDFIRNPLVGEYSIITGAAIFGLFALYLYYNQEI